METGFLSKWKQEQECDRPHLSLLGNVRIKRSPDLFESVCCFQVVFEEQKERRFHGLKLEWGFDLFVPHGVFTEASNGFLIDDTCVLGAEVFVSKESSTGKGECLSMVKDPVMYKKIWVIDNFSKLDGKSYDSKVFTAGDQKWKIQLYPKGKSNGVGTHLALYLALAEPKSLPRGWKMYAEFSLRLLDQVHARHQFGEGKDLPNPIAT